MNWTTLLNLLPTALNALKLVTSAVPSSTQITSAPSDAIKELQHLINTYAPPSPPLNEDGWLGPKTEAAILSAVMALGPLLASFFGKKA